MGVAKGLFVSWNLTLAGFHGEDRVSDVVGAKSAEARIIGVRNGFPTICCRLMFQS